MTELQQHVTTSDQDIPFPRMVALSFKWAVAAIPALIFLYFFFAAGLMLLNGAISGPNPVDVRSIGAINVETSSTR